MRFNPKTQDELEASMLQHGQTYDFDVAEAEEKVSKSGNDMLALKLKVYTNDGNEHYVRDWLVSSDALPCIAKLNAFCKATGLHALYDAGDLDAMACQGATGRVKIGVEETEQYGRQFKVMDYIGDAPAPSHTSPAPPQGVPASQTKAAMAAADERGDSDIPF